MIPGILIGMGLGLIMPAIFDTKKQGDDEQNQENPYFVEVEMKDGKNYILRFSNYQKAAEMYNFLKSQRSIKVEDIVANSEKERKLRDKAIRHNGEDAVPRIDQVLPITFISWGISSSTFEEHDLAEEDWQKQAEQNRKDIIALKQEAKNREEDEKNKAQNQQEQLAQKSE